MNRQRQARVRSLATKALRAIPEVVLHPGQLYQAYRGAHWATLNMLDSAWMRDLQINTVIDVGANQGQFASACRAVFPKATIYSFEPLPSCYAVLEERFSSQPNIVTFNVALAKEDASATMFENQFSESSSFLPINSEHIEAFPWTSGQRQVHVTTRMLDSVRPEILLVSPVLMKLDVQGYEMSVLNGGMETLPSIDFVLVETSYTELYQGESTFDELYQFMISQGFALAGILEQLRHPRTGKPLQADALFARKSSLCGSAAQ